MEINGFMINFQGAFKPAEFQPSLLFEYNVEETNLASLIKMYEFSENVSSFSIQNTFYFMDNHFFQITDYTLVYTELVNKLKKLFENLKNSNASSFSIYNYVHFKLENQKLWNKRKGEKLHKLGGIFPIANYPDAVVDSKMIGASELPNLKTNVTQKLEDYYLTKYYTIERSNHEQTKNGVFVMIQFEFKYKSKQPLVNLYRHAISEVDTRYIEAQNIFQEIKKVN